MRVHPCLDARQPAAPSEEPQSVALMCDLNRSLHHPLTSWMLPAGSSAVERRPWAEARSALGVGLLEAVDQLGEPVRRGCEAECLARAAVELRGDLVEALLADPGEARSLREVMAKQAVGVLVGAPLPRAAGIAEVDLDPGLDREAPVLGHL